MYVVNDIENLVLLNDLGVFPIIKSRCGEIILTNIRLNDFSHAYIQRILKLSDQDVIIVEVELDYYQFCEENRSQLKELGDGDMSSLYYAQSYDATVITCSDLVTSAAKELDISTISVDELVSNHISDGVVIEMFKQLRIA